MCSNIHFTDREVESRGSRLSQNINQLQRQELEEFGCVWVQVPEDGAFGELKAGAGIWLNSYFQVWIPANLPPCTTLLNHPFPPQHIIPFS